MLRKTILTSLRPPTIMLKKIKKCLTLGQKYVVFATDCNLLTMLLTYHQRYGSKQCRDWDEDEVCKFLHVKHDIRGNFLMHWLK